MYKIAYDNPFIEKSKSSHHRKIFPLTCSKVVSYFQIKGETINFNFVQNQLQLKILILLKKKIFKLV